MIYSVVSTERSWSWTCNDMVRADRLHFAVIHDLCRLEISLIYSFVGLPTEDCNTQCSTRSSRKLRRNIGYSTKKKILVQVCIPNMNIEKKLWKFILIPNLIYFLWNTFSHTRSLNGKLLIKVRLVMKWIWMNQNSILSIRIIVATQSCKIYMHVYSHAHSYLGYTLYRIVATETKVTCFTYIYNKVT